MLLILPIIVLIYSDRLVGFVTSSIVTIQFAYVLWSSSKANESRERAHEIYRLISGIIADEISNIVAYKSSGKELELRSKINELSLEENYTFWIRHKVAILLDLPRSLLTQS